MILNFDENVSKILAENKLKKINKYFAKHKFDVDALDFIKYSLISMKLRENSKFIFTRTLSDLLEIISFYGRKYGLNKKQLSNLELKQIIHLDKYSKVKRKNYYQPKLKMIN